jgi:hypothetical protein
MTLGRHRTDEGRQLHVRLLPHLAKADRLLWPPLPDGTASVGRLRYIKPVCISI